MTRPEFRLAGPVLDSPNPVALAKFYQRLLGWQIVRSEGPKPGNPPEDGWAILRSPDGTQKVEVQWEPHYTAPKWPAQDGKQLMMIHLDFGVASLAAAVQWALDVGATLADHQPQEQVRVMLDPDGHPFCLFPDQE